jgi:hypothetical protein
VKENEQIHTKNTTIKIIDGLDNEQRYYVEIMTNGKQTKDYAVLPKVMFMVTNHKKEVKLDVSLDVEYTIKVSKTNVQSAQEIIYRKQETKKRRGGQPTEGGVLAQIEFTPTNETYILEIKVNP